jgi:hypothetical protein
MQGEIDEVLRLHGVQERQTKFWLLQRNDKCMHTLPQTTSNSSLLQAKTKYIFEKTIRSVGKLLATVDESIPAAS